MLPSSLASPLAVLVLFFVSPSWQYVRIELKNGSTSLGHKYDDNSLFSYNFANFPSDGKMNGYVWQWEAFPNNGCRYITPLPYSARTSLYKWFALIDDMGACQGDMIKNVRNAGFDLVVGYSNGSSGTSDIPKSLIESEFPIVSISGDYADRLLRDAATDSPAGAVRVEVLVENFDVLLVGMCAGCLVSLFTFCFVLSCVFYCRHRSRRGQYSFTGAPHGDPRFRYAQARLARQELIESILRQLQELQGEDRLHTPLGEAQTRALPQMTFAEARREGTTGTETCAICVEEFQESDVTRVLPCKHFFHPNCIDPWLTEHSSMCPLCKQSVSEDQRPEGATAAAGSVHLSTGESDSTEDFSTPILTLSNVTNIPSASTLTVPTSDDSSSRSSASVTSDAPLVSSCPSVNNA